MKNTSLTHTHAGMERWEAERDEHRPRGRCGFLGEGFSLPRRAPAQFCAATSAAQPLRDWEPCPGIHELPKGHLPRGWQPRGVLPARDAFSPSKSSARLETRLCLLLTHRQHSGTVPWTTLRYKTFYKEHLTLWRPKQTALHLFACSTFPCLPDFWGKATPIIHTTSSNKTETLQKKTKGCSKYQ